MIRVHWGVIRAVASVLLLAACSSSSARLDAGLQSEIPPATYYCPMTIDELRAAAPMDASPDPVDYNADFATASAAYNASGTTCRVDYQETFSRCDGAYDTMTWYSYPNCVGGQLYYDHASGALVAVLHATPLGGGACYGYHGVAGPPAFFAPLANCTTVASCVP